MNTDVIRYQINTLNVNNILPANYTIIKLLKIKIRQKYFFSVTGESDKRMCKEILAQSMWLSLALKPCLTLLQISENERRWETCPRCLYPDWGPLTPSPVITLKKLVNLKNCLEVVDKGYTLIK